MQVDLGEVDKDTGIALLVELLVAPRPEGKFRIAQAEVNYDVPALSLVDETSEYALTGAVMGTDFRSLSTFPSAMSMYAV